MAFVRAANLGDRLYEVRLALRMTQADFGALMGVVDQTVSDYETGRSQPQVSRLRRLASLLQIPDTVFQEGGPMPATLPIRAPSSPAEPRSLPEPGLGAGEQETASLAVQLDDILEQIQSARAAGELSDRERDLYVRYLRAKADLLEQGGG